MDLGRQSTVSLNLMNGNRTEAVPASVAKGFPFATTSAFGDA